MKQIMPFSVTISRQLGCGGAFVGQQLANKLNFFYADREIIRKAAKRLSVLENDLESRDEKIPSFWESFYQVTTFSPEINLIPASVTSTSRELFEAEAEVIRHIANQRSAVIIGRCGFHLLHEHPNHISVFLHADMAFRNNRIQNVYEVSKETADKMIVKSDKKRAAYCKTFTGKEWTDARNYDISVDTGKTGVDNTIDIILNFVKLFKG
jgi:CMP/dCMP kinase